MGLDADGSIPAFMDMTSGKVHEINWAKTLKLSKGSFVCFDRGFTDYAWYNDLTINSIFFVTRLKSNADVEYSIVATRVLLNVIASLSLTWEVCGFTFTASLVSAI